MKKELAFNKFIGGILLDMHPLTIESDTLSNCLNGTVITYNGNEYMLLNDMGNGRVETAMLPSGYTPLGITSFGGIIYILSYNPLIDKFLMGSFPSPERNFSQDEVTDVKLSIEFKNFYTIDEQEENKKFNEDNVITLPLYQIILYNEEIHPGDKFKICVNGLKELMLTSTDGYNEKSIISGFSTNNTSFDHNLFPRYIKFDVIGVLKNGSIVNITKDLTWTDLGDSTIPENPLENTNFYLYPYEFDNPTLTPDDMLNEYRGSVNSQYDVFSSKYSGKLGLIAKYEAPSKFSAGFETVIKPLYREYESKTFETNSSTKFNQCYVLYENLDFETGDDITISFDYRFKNINGLGYDKTTDLGNSQAFVYCSSFAPAILCNIKDEDGNLEKDWMSATRERIYFSGRKEPNEPNKDNPITEATTQPEYHDWKSYTGTFKNIKKYEKSEENYMYLRFDLVSFGDSVSVYNDDSEQKKYEDILKLGRIEIQNFKVYSKNSKRFIGIPKLTLLDDTQIKIKNLNKGFTESGSAVQTTFQIYQLPNLSWMSLKTYDDGSYIKYEYDENGELKLSNKYKVSFKYKFTGLKTTDILYNNSGDEEKGFSRCSIQLGHDFGYPGIYPSSGYSNNLFVNSMNKNLVDENGYTEFKGYGYISEAFNRGLYNDSVVDGFGETVGALNKHIYLRFVNTSLSNTIGTIDIKDFKIYIDTPVPDGYQDDFKLLYANEDSRGYTSLADFYFPVNWSNDNVGKHKNRVNPKGIEVVIKDENDNELLKKDYDIKLKYKDPNDKDNPWKYKTSDTLDDVDYYAIDFPKDYYKSGFDFDNYLRTWDNQDKNNKFLENPKELRANNGTDNDYLVKGMSVKYNKDNFMIDVPDLKNNESSIINFSVTPKMPFGKLNYLTRNFQADLSKLGTGYIELSKYRYYVEYDDTKNFINGGVTLSFSFDTYLENNKNITGVILNIYNFDKNSISETKVHSTTTPYTNSSKLVYQSVIIELFYNTDINHYINFFNETIENKTVKFEKDNIYLVEFVVIYGNELRYYHRILHTSKIFNNAYATTDDYSSLYLYDPEQHKNNIGVDLNITLSDVKLNIKQIGTNEYNFKKFIVLGESFSKENCDVSQYVTMNPEYNISEILCKYDGKDLTSLKNLIQPIVNKGNLLITPTLNEESDNDVTLERVDEYTYIDQLSDSSRSLPTGSYSTKEIRPGMGGDLPGTGGNKVDDPWSNGDITGNTDGTGSTGNTGSTVGGMDITDSETGEEKDEINKGSIVGNIITDFDNNTTDWNNLICENTEYRWKFSDEGAYCMLGTNNNESWLLSKKIRVDQKNKLTVSLKSSILTGTEYDDNDIFEICIVYSAYRELLKDNEFDLIDDNLYNIFVKYTPIKSYKIKSLGNSQSDLLIDLADVNLLSNEYCIGFRVNSVKQLNYIDKIIVKSVYYKTTDTPNSGNIINNTVTTNPNSKTEYNLFRFNVQKPIPFKNTPLSKQLHVLYPVDLATKDENIIKLNLNLNSDSDIKLTDNNGTVDFTNLKTKYSDNIQGSAFVPVIVNITSESEYDCSIAINNDKSETAKLSKVDENYLYIPTDDGILLATSWLKNYKDNLAANKGNGYWMHILSGEVGDSYKYNHSEQLNLDCFKKYGQKSSNSNISTLESVTVGKYKTTTLFNIIDDDLLYVCSINIDNNKYLSNVIVNRYRYEQSGLNPIEGSITLNINDDVKSKYSDNIKLTSDTLNLTSDKAGNIVFNLLDENNKINNYGVLRLSHIIEEIKKYEEIPVEEGESKITEFEIECNLDGEGIKNTFNIFNSDGSLLITNINLFYKISFEHLEMGYYKLDVNNKLSKIEGDLFDDSEPTSWNITELYTNGKTNRATKLEISQLEEDLSFYVTRIYSNVIADRDSTSNSPLNGLFKYKNVLGNLVNYYNTFIFRNDDIINEKYKIYNISSGVGSNAERVSREISIYNSEDDNIIITPIKSEMFESFSNNLKNEFIIIPVEIKKDTETKYGVGVYRKALNSYNYEFGCELTDIKETEIKTIELFYDVNEQNIVINCLYKKDDGTFMFTPILISLDDSMFINVYDKEALESKYSIDDNNEKRKVNIEFSSKINLIEGDLIENKKIKNLTINTINDTLGTSETTYEGFEINKNGFKYNVDNAILIKDEYEQYELLENIDDVYPSGGLSQLIYRIKSTDSGFEIVKTSEFENNLSNIKLTKGGKTITIPIYTYEETKIYSKNDE